MSCQEDNLLVNRYGVMKEPFNILCQDLSLQVKKTIQEQAKNFGLRPEETALLYYQVISNLTCSQGEYALRYAMQKRKEEKANKNIDNNTEI